jgi:hypothetical protein
MKKTRRSVMSAEENKKIVMKLLENASLGKIPEIASMLRDDIMFWAIGHLPPPFTGTKNKQEILEMFGGLGTLFPDGLKVIVDHMIAEGDYVAVEAHSDGKLANGKAYENRYHLKFELKDGKIQNWKHYDDTLYFKDIVLDGK